MFGKLYIEVNNGAVEAAYSENEELLRYYRFDGDTAGNIYRGKVERITGAGAFVDIGREKHGFLPKRERLNVGDYVTVQTEREEDGRKGCLLTEKLTAAGKFTVVLSGEEIRFSRKLSAEKRTELLDLNCGRGIIFRTACMNANPTEIVSEATDMRQKLEEIKNKASNLYRVELLRRAETNLIAYNLFPHAEIIESLDEVRESVEKLKLRRVECDGVEIVIDKTEAMTVIDVNSHTKLGGGDAEVDALNVNITAAVLIAKQIRLRNIGGIIAVDFVSMKDPVKIAKLKSKFLDELKKDDVLSRLEFVDSMCVALITRKKLYSSN